MLQIIKSLLSRPTTLLSLGIVSFIALYGIITSAKYATFGYNALDLGIFNQVFFNTLHGQWFASSIHAPSYLGDHWSPIIALLLPFYAIAPHAMTLVMMQLFALAIIAVLLYVIALPRIGQWWALGLSFAWLANPFVGRVALFEFSVLPFTALGLLVAYYGYNKKRFWLLLVGAVIMASTREDAALAVIGFTLLALYDRRTVRWWLTPILVGMGGALIGFLIINQFALGDGYKFLIYYSWLGETPNQALKTLLQKPWLPLLLIARPANMLFVVALTLPLLFLPLLQPRLLLLALIPSLQFFLGSAGASLTVLQTQYASFFLAPAFLASIDGITHLKQKKLPWYIPPVPLIFAITVLYTALALGPLPDAGALINKSLWQQASARLNLLATIPQNAGVAASYDTVPIVSSRANVFSFNYAFLGSRQFLRASEQLPNITEYVVFDYQDLITYQLQYGNNPFYEKRYHDRLWEWPDQLEGFAPVAVADTLVLFKKNPAEKEIIWLVRREQAAGNRAPVSDTGFIEAAHGADWLTVVWDGASIPAEERIIVLTLTDAQGNTSTRSYPWAYGMFYGESSSNDTLTMRYRLGLESGLASGDYNASITLSTVDGGGIEIDSARSTKNVIDHTITFGQPIAIGKITLP